MDIGIIVSQNVGLAMMLCALFGAIVVIGLMLLSHNSDS